MVVAYDDRGCGDGGNPWVPERPCRGDFGIGLNAGGDHGQLMRHPDLTPCIFVSDRIVGHLHAVAVLSVMFGRPQVAVEDTREKGRPQRGGCQVRKVNNNMIRAGARLV